jgi:deazaflavin-dependent oxidoreductase (nitroreductase family)
MSTSLNVLKSLASEQYCYLTTTGRVSGKPHTVEIWFAASPDKSCIYILAGGGYRSDWVKNIGNNVAVSVQVGDVTYAGRGRIIETDEEILQARKLVVAKYYGRAYDPAGGWEAEALPMAIDVEA